MTQTRSVQSAPYPYAPLRSPAVASPAHCLGTTTVPGLAPSPVGLLFSVPGRPTSTFPDRRHLERRPCA